MKKPIGALMLLSLCATLWAYDPLKDETDNSNYVPQEEWREGEFEVPQTVHSEDLQSFSVDQPDQRFSYFIERSSLKTGDDYVTRYLLVIRSAQGAINSSYEGMRCGYRLYKVYAYGNAEKLSPMPGDEWRAVPRGGRADYRTRLYDDLLCNLQTGQANPPAVVFKAMRDDQRVGSLLHPN